DLLTAKGHVVADMRLFVREDAIWIVVDGGQGETVAGMLARYAIMDDFAAALRPDFAFSALLGPAAAARLAALGADPGAPAEVAGFSHAKAAARWAAWLVVSDADVDAGGGAGLGLARVRELDSSGFWVGGPPATLTAVHERL